MLKIQGSYKDIYKVNFLDIAFADSTRALSAEFYANGYGRIPVVLSLSCTDSENNDLSISSLADSGLHIVNSQNNEIVPFDDNNSTWFISESANEFTSADYGSLGREILPPTDSLDKEHVIPINSYVVYLSARDVKQVTTNFYVSVTAGDGKVYSTSSKDFNFEGIMQLNVTGKAPKNLNYSGNDTPSVTNSTPSQGGDFVFSRETIGYISSDRGGSGNYYNYYLRMIDGVIAKVEFNQGEGLTKKYPYEDNFKVESYRPYSLKVENKTYNGFMWRPDLHSENELVSAYLCYDLFSNGTLRNNSNEYKFHICRDGLSSLCLTRLQTNDVGPGDGITWKNELYIYDQYGNRGVVNFPRPDNYGKNDIKIKNGAWTG